MTSVRHCTVLHHFCAQTPGVTRSAGVRVERIASTRERCVRTSMSVARNRVSSERRASTRPPTSTALAATATQVHNYSTFQLIAVATSFNNSSRIFFLQVAFAKQLSYKHRRWLSVWERSCSSCCAQSSCSVSSFSSSRFNPDPPFATVNHKRLPFSAHPRHSRLHATSQTSAVHARRARR